MMRHPALLAVALGLLANALSVPVSAQEQGDKVEAPSDDAPASDENATEGLFEWMGDFAEKLRQTQAGSQAQNQDFDTTKPVVGFGFQIVDEKMRVANVLPRSAAEAAGLELDMIILRINGVRMQGFELVEIAKILGAIDGEIIFDVEGRGRYSLIKAPIAELAQ